MDYKKMYYSLFNSITDVIRDTTKENDAEALDILQKLNQAQIDSESLFIELSNDVENTIDLKAIKSTINNRVG